MQVCGYDRISETYGVPFLDMQKDTATVHDCAGMELSICDQAKQLDFLINVPVMKGHCQTKITCALKNMKGLIPKQGKAPFPFPGASRAHRPSGSGYPPGFHCGGQYLRRLDFEDGGNPVVMNRLMAAADPVLCDAWVCHLMGYPVEEVPYISMAAAPGGRNG